MTSLSRYLLGFSLVATTALAIMLGVTDRAEPLYYPTAFLIWNLVLAWMPMFFAAGFALVRRRVWLIPLGLGWLVFLPNAPYLVTDLVHLDDNAELWRHVLQYGVAAWTGIILGAVSLWLVHRRIEREAGVLVGWAAAIVSVGLCAIGVVIGRFQRWNSWDLVTDPRAVATSTLDWVRSPFSYVQSTGVAIAVAAFFGLAYLTVWSLCASGREEP
ncbi:DUF1361 domain-containing protein [Mycolicibacterium elephantis]